jgi:hypothetical protein
LGTGLWGESDFVCRSVVAGEMFPGDNGSAGETQTPDLHAAGLHLHTLGGACSGCAGGVLVAPNVLQIAHSAPDKSFYFRDAPICALPRSVQQNGAFPESSLAVIIYMETAPECGSAVPSLRFASADGFGACRFSNRGGHASPCQARS